MTNLADRTIAMLRTNHERLVSVVAPLTDSDLDLPSGSAEWDVAQVLSHLGSQAEIGRAGLERALAGLEPNGPEFNPSVWARWDAKGQREKADDWLVATEAYLQAFEAIDPPTRASLSINLGFLPFPADLAMASGLRLNEVVLHAWDVRFALDRGATIPADEAGLLLEQLQGPLSFLIGFLGKAEPLGSVVATVRVEATQPDVTFGIVLGERIGLVASPDTADAVMSGTVDAVLRLIAGRMPADLADDALTISGSDLHVALLREVFPGY